MSKTLLTLILLLTSLSHAYASTDDGVTGITISGNYPTVFHQYEPFSTTGMVVKDQDGNVIEDNVTFENGETSEIGTRTVTVEYNSNSTTYDITVRENPLIVTDELTAESLGLQSSTYTDFESQPFPSSAVYKGKSNKADGTIGFDNGHGTFLTVMTSPGKLMAIDVSYNQFYVGALSLRKYDTYTATIANIKNTGSPLCNFGDSKSTYTNDENISIPYFGIHVTNRNGTAKLNSLSVTWRKPGYLRALTNDNYGTICMPYAVAADEHSGATFYTIVGKTQDASNNITGIVIEEVTGELEAGVSYIYKGIIESGNNTGTLLCKYHGDKTTTASTANGMVGNLSDNVIPVTAGKYILSNNVLRKVNGGTAKIAPNRAYIDLSNVPTYTASTNSRTRTIKIADDNATSITATQSDTYTPSHYSVSGIKTVGGLNGIDIIQMPDGSVRKTLKK